MNHSILTMKQEAVKCAIAEIITALIYATINLALNGYFK